jgi:DNA-binding PadR family transcriptional regulator
MEAGRERHAPTGASTEPVSAGYALTDSGRAWLQRLGFEAPEPSTRRRYAYPCLDWSERRGHLAGPPISSTCIWGPRAG